MALPETIPVKYTEGEDAYLSVRPVVRQTFHLEELLDMVLVVTGKNVPRVQQILRSGTVVYHFYRYWWPGFEAEPEELAALLARFPEPDPARPFRVEECIAALLESGGQGSRRTFQVSPEAASRRRLLHASNFWDCLMHLAKASLPGYQDYSYARRADLFAREVSPSEAEQLGRDAARLAPRSLRVQLALLRSVARIVFVCPRAK